MSEHRRHIAEHRVDHHRSEQQQQRVVRARWFIAGQVSARRAGFINR